MYIIEQLCSEIWVDVVIARSSPQYMATIVVGDWNFRAPGEVPTSLPRPSLVTTAAHLKKTIVATRPGQAALSKILDKLLELKQPCPTHFNQAADPLSRLNRCYCSSPGWVVTDLELKFDILAAP